MEIEDKENVVPKYVLCSELCVKTKVVLTTKGIDTIKRCSSWKL